jgi:hypothetical protein
MSKIFSHDQTAGRPRVAVMRASDGTNVYRPATEKDRDLVQPRSVDPEEMAMGMLALIALLVLAVVIGLVLYLWWREILVGTFLFLIFLRLMIRLIVGR